MPTIIRNASNRLTAEEIEVRVWAFVIVVLVSILLGAMAMFLYSVTYVTQPMSGMAPGLTAAKPLHMLWLSWQQRRGPSPAALLQGCPKGPIGLRNLTHAQPPICTVHSILLRLSTIHVALHQQTAKATYN